jgi:dTDP-glucose 4,6-dehydratase
MTGASGFVGKWLLISWIVAREQFGSRGQLTCVSRHQGSYPESLYEDAVRAGVDFQFTDIRNLAVLELSDVHGIIHGATPTTLGLAQTALFETVTTILDGQRAVLDFATRNGIQRVLFLSSGAVYGIRPLDDDDLSEDDLTAPDPLNATTGYHEAKRLAENLGAIAALNGDIEFLSARLFAFLAPLLPLDAHFAAGNFIRDVLRGRDVQINGTGKSLRSYQYGTDLVTWLWTILGRGRNVRAYNVGSDEASSIEHLASLVIGSSGKNLKLLKSGLAVNASDSRYIPSISRARQELGLQNLVPLASGIDRTLSWWSIR